MEKIECSKEDLKIAIAYFETFVGLRTHLRMGQLEREDFEDYMACKEKMLSKRQHEIADVFFEWADEEKL